MKTAKEFVNKLYGSAGNTAIGKDVMTELVSGFEKEVRRDQVNKCVDAISIIEPFETITGKILDPKQIIKNTIKENNDRNGDQTSGTGND